MTTLPDHELALFLNTVTVAVDQARAGHVGTGFRELWYGVERAEAVGEGESWGPELVTRYREAADRYTREYGERLVGQGA